MKKKRTTYQLVEHKGRWHGTNVIKYGIEIDGEPITEGSSKVMVTWNLEEWAMSRINAYMRQNPDSVLLEDVKKCTCCK